MNETLDMKDVRSYSIENIEELMISYGEPKFRAKQLFAWLHEKRVENFSDMTNLPASLRKKLIEDCRLITLKPVKVLESAIDGTCKYLFELYDGNIIESVFMRYKHGNSVCISSQVGCRMGCKFCASTLDGCVRNLTASEMLEQIYRIEAHKGERISNVVIMGSGEPLDNFDNLIRFIDLITDEKGFNLSGRNITVSTCGIVPKMYELAEKGYPLTLAVSLHASTQEKRKALMPIANKYDIHELIKACKDYFEKTGRRMTFEYSLVEGVNDGDEDARELIALLKGLNAHINLIPVNPIKERNFTQTKKEAVLIFKDKLEKSGKNVTIRREMGRDINGACGQLRRSYIDESKKE
ncbi:MAG: 23S rRNA (adenine(2503)-C(2))-methyltransferase RlmN [Lachnospiraceae bacterium]|nr:23S rRNA (adenine(2503)-C(2))-methyltransferase RlmN [Lachnospiraceae bacterium]